jgi:CRISPR-associated protein Csx10
MAQLAVKIEMAEPFLVGSRKLATVTESLGYVPGSVLRGVVAEALLRELPEGSRRVSHPDHCPDRANCPFCQLFYPETGLQPRFGNLYPTSGDVAYPFPATARSCKHHPGFRRDDYDPDERHGIFDILIRQYTFEKVLERGKPLPFIYLPDCPRCRAKAEPVSSPFYGLLADRYQAPEILRRRISRTAISRRRGAAEEEQLFTLNVLGERMDTDFLDEDGMTIKQITTLRGRVWVDDDSVEAMQAALGQVERIGAVRSRGMGRVARIEATAITTSRHSGRSEESTALFLKQVIDGAFALPEQLQTREYAREPLRPDSLSRRLVAFNVRFRAEQEFYAKLGTPLPGDRWYFTVNLLSDTILTDDGLPTLRLTPAMLNLTGGEFPKVDLERTFVGRTHRSGWSGAYGLPRPVHLAVPMGGVYLYSVEATGEEATGRLLERLDHLEQDGLGLDRERGCGQVMVCLPFHLEVEAR